MTAILKELDVAVVDGNVFDRARFLTVHAPEIRAALELQARVDAGVLQAFEAKFWEAVQLSGSRDFDHDVCKEVRDFRAMLNAAPPAGGEQP